MPARSNQACTSAVSSSSTALSPALSPVYPWLSTEMAELSTDCWFPADFFPRRRLYLLATTPSLTGSLVVVVEVYVLLPGEKSFPLLAHGRCLPRERPQAHALRH